ncbi:MAG: hypothetical protein K0R88_902 [Solirubrobacterales bacterium]|jgi:hypothetical protein|nr:hypothetical protein [Solirubrobacterales bacterium]
MNAMLTILYLDAHRAELHNRAERSRHSESAHLRHERRVRRPI